MNGTSKAGAVQNVSSPQANSGPGGERLEECGPALAALAGFADNAVAPLLLLAFLEADRNGECGLELRRLSLMLRELQAAVLPDKDRIAVTSAAIRRLFAAATAMA